MLKNIHSHLVQTLAVLLFSVISGCGGADSSRHEKADACTQGFVPTVYPESTPYAEEAEAMPLRPAGRVIAGRRVFNEAPATIAAKGVKLIIDSGAVERDVEISIVATDEGHSGRIPANMTNLTEGGGVYRMLPDGQRFAKDITIAMSYDSGALPYGYDADDIRTFFYNESCGMWQQIERDSVDTVNHIVYSRTNHFTDYINGVLKVPENSDAVAYTPTAVKDLKAADPLEGITLLSPPEANSQGTASMSYPLVVPAGRHGMQPRLAVSYSSGGGSGILGMGWSLPLSEISVETRWGVPLYDQDYETEGYLLDGTTLVTAHLDGNGNMRLDKPVYHRKYEPRSGSAAVQFYPRVEGAFRKIERKGTGPDNYHWEVTDKDGTRHIYGERPEATLRDPQGNIAKWMLERTEDTYGNTVTYSYTTRHTIHTGEPSGKQLCISRIRYTGKAGTADKGQYIVRFRYCDKRDAGVSFRYGLEETDNQLLDRVEVMFRDSIVREYYFGYRRGAFGKTLLCSIVEGYDDSARCQLYQYGGGQGTLRSIEPYERCDIEPYGKTIFPRIYHAFEYNDLKKELFGDAVPMSCEGEGEKIYDRFDSVMYENGDIGGSMSAGWDIHGGVNVGTDYLAWLKTVTAGGHFSYSSDKSEGLMQLVDINGDGYPDKLYRSVDGSLKCRPQKPGEDEFGAPEPIVGVGSFLRSSSSGQSYGIEASAAVAGVGVSWNDSRSSTTVYVSDVNGDGLVDIVDNGRVYLNRGGYRFDDVTYNDTIRTGGTCEEEATDFGGGIDTTVYDDGWYGVEHVECVQRERAVPTYDTVYNVDDSYQLIPNGGEAVEVYDSCWTVVDSHRYSYPRRYEPDVDLVRMWKVPYTGRVEVTGTAKLTDALRDYRAATRTKDGVRASVQVAGESAERVSRAIVPDDPQPIECEIDVDEGDTLFFRLRAADKRLYDQVEWNPHIEYLQASHRNDVEALPLTRVDANGDHIYRFDYGDDYMLTAGQSVTAGADNGTACTNSYAVACMIKALEPLSQDMVYSLVKSNVGTGGGEQVLDSRTYNVGSEPDETVIWEANGVLSSEKLTLRLSPAGGGQLNWSAIESEATVTMTGSTDATVNARLGDPDSREAYVYHPVVERRYYDYMVFPGTVAQGITGTPNITLAVTRSDGQPFNGQLYLTVKSIYGNACFGKSVTVSGGSAVESTYPYVFSFGTGEMYSVDCYTDNLTYAAAISGIAATFSGNIQCEAGLYAKYAPDSSKHHGTLYRGWGQFGYKVPDTTVHHIVSALLQTPAYYSDTNSVPRPTDSIINSYNATGIGTGDTPETSATGIIPNPLAGSFFEMYADGRKGRWHSFANLVTASRSVASLDNSNPDVENGQAAEADMCQSPLPVVVPGTKMKAVNKLTFSDGKSRTGLLQTHSEGTSRLLSDFMDLNGDRHPDVVSESRIQYSRAQGGLGTLTRGYSTGDGINRTENSSTGKANNGTFLRLMYEMVPNAKRSRVVSTMAGLVQMLAGANDSTVSSDATQNTLMDINGDGLPDVVRADGTVQYNKGYGFTAPRASTATTLIRASRSVARGMGYGFNVGNTSITGNIGVNLAKNKTTYALQDINGDGLPDMVSASQVNINKGDGTFATYSAGGVEDGASTAFSAGTGGTYDAVFSICGFPLKVGLSVGGGASATFSRTAAEYIDMDNDGYADYVYRKNGTIMVRYSNIGKANLLRHVGNFAGATYKIEYSQNEATVRCPQRHWNMTALDVYDGMDGDGESHMHKSFSYGNRVYDRYEREDYGYDTVKTSEYVTDADYASGTVYRTTTEEFHNGDYYHAHLKSRDSVTDGIRYTTTTYTYGDADLRDGHWLGGGVPAWCEGDGWPAVAVEETRHSEGTGTVIATRREYTYSEYGNVKKVEERGDIGDGGDDYTVDIAYAHDPLRYIVSNVSSLSIPGYRSRTATYTAEGSLQDLTVYNTPSPSSVYQYKYDAYGNVEKVTTPMQMQGGGDYSISYTYDALTHTLPTTTTNSEGHTSQATYSLRWQKPTSTKDIGGNMMRYRYDSHGRTDTIVAPKEAAAGRPYTVCYSYWYGCKYDVDNPLSYNAAMGEPMCFWARTHNYDPCNPGNDIVTLTFGDGLGRVVQVKKDVATGGMEERAVGGTVHYDGLGRKVRECLPVSEPLTDPDTMLNGGVGSAPYTQTKYDIFDRPTDINFADGTAVYHTYGMAPDGNSINRFLTSTTDQNGHTSHLLADARGLNVEYTDALGGTTAYAYDAIGQLQGTTDPEGNTTTHTYDLGGRRIKRVHPSAGTTQWTYDAAGSMVKQAMNNGEMMTIAYDCGRPVHVGYSQRPWNDVRYEYGAVGTGNGAGRMVRQQDASGVQEFGYDCMGNVEYNLHTYVQPHAQATLSLVTRWVYDSWGRVDTIVYPDREKVSYSYDQGGLLRRMEGSKPGQTSTVYIEQIHYDHMGQRTYVLNGNGVETEYLYNPQNQRLMHLTNTSTLANLTLQDNSYTYDYVGNILNISDGGLHTRSQDYEYDNINRLVHSTGDWDGSALGYECNYTYSAAGRMLGKEVTSQRMGTLAGGMYSMNYQHSYAYPATGNVFAPGSIQDNLTSTAYSLTWDANGNLEKCTGNGTSRHLCWTEDNRMQAYLETSATEGDLAAYYSYAADGTRSLKLVSPRLVGSQNVINLGAHHTLAYPTLYASPLLTMTRQGYTKHYFEGDTRVCSKIGGGFGNVRWTEVDTLAQTIDDVDYMYLHWKQHEGVENTFLECLGETVELADGNDLRSMLDNEQDRNDYEPVFYYHMDHLGSASYLTNGAGQVTQTLNYLPYGEDWVDVQNMMETDYPRLGIYTFNGKEKDYESSFHYYGARYYWSEVLTGWLSVDPMADKYPGTSPYTYCMWNPVKLVDPDGCENIPALLWARKNMSNKGIPSTYNNPYFGGSDGRWNYQRGTVPDRTVCYESCFMAYMNSTERVVSLLKESGFATSNGGFVGRSTPDGGINWFKKGDGSDRSFVTDIKKGELGDIVFMGESASMRGHAVLLNGLPEFATDEDGNVDNNTIILNTLSTSSDSDPENYGEKRFVFKKQKNGTWKQEGGEGYMFRGYGQLNADFSKEEQ